MTAFIRPRRQTSARLRGSKSRHENRDNGDSETINIARQRTRPGTFDDTDHRVQCVQRPPPTGMSDDECATGVVQPDLCQNGSVPDVAIADVERRQQSIPSAETRASSVSGIVNRDRWHAVVGHHPQKEDERDPKSDSATATAKSAGAPRKIDLSAAADCDHAVARLGQRERRLPGQLAQRRKTPGWQPIRGQSRAVQRSR